jgi:glutamyl-tRNA synthetase
LTENPPDRSSPRVVGRLAPSPTGGLHLGHARTFLIAWLFARRSLGQVILRIEDLDSSRVRADALTGALVDLRWLGLDWDQGPDIGGPSGPYIQSARSAPYGQTLDLLTTSESVYPCTCSRADVERAASAPHAADEGPTYPGTCSHRSAADAIALREQNRPFAWRFRVPNGPVAWDDLFLGPTRLDPSRLGGDFIVAREGSSAGAGAGYSYQLAVVADDDAMGVNQVVRGDDLVPSTPRQILLFHRLGRPVPTFGHVPLAIDPDGRRLAKRDNSLKLSTLRASGVDPRRLICSLVHSCGWSKSNEPMTPTEAIDRCNPVQLSRAPWVVTPEHLTWLTSNPDVTDNRSTY